MLISFENGNVNIRAKSDVELFERAEQRKRIEEIREEQNLETVIELAANQLHDAENVSDEPVDEDWITRYYNIVKNVSVEEMQLIWAKILSEEVKTPGAFSLRTLETVRNLSNKEAIVFQKILPLILLGENDGTLEGLIISDDNILSKFGVSFSDIKLMDECGLMISNSLVNYNFRNSGKERILFHNKNYVITIEAEETAPKQSLGIYLLTQAGKELYNTIATESNLEYVKSVADCIHRKNIDLLEVKIYKTVRIEQNTISYERYPILTLKRTIQIDDQL